MNRLISLSIFLFIAGLESMAQQKDISIKQLPSMQKPADAAGIFTIYPGDGIPANSGKSAGHERTVQVPDC